MISSILMRYAETEDGSGSIRSIGDGPMFPNVSITRNLCRRELQLSVPLLMGRARFMCLKSNFYTSGQCIIKYVLSFSPPSFKFSFQSFYLQYFNNWFKMPNSMNKSVTLPRISKS
jgi:hypothetical protein